MKTDSVKEAIHCTAKSGEVGCFMFKGNNHRTGELVSPVFSSYDDLCNWRKDNGYAADMPGYLSTTYSRKESK